MTKKSLKINKQNLNLSSTKGSQLLFFQFCIHLMNLSLAFLPPGSGSRRQFFMRFRADSDPDPKHCLKRKAKSFDYVE